MSARKEDSKFNQSNERTGLLIRTQSDFTRKEKKDMLDYMSTSTVSSLEALKSDLEKSGGKEPQDLTWEKYGRGTLYGSLPFMAAFGMQKKETTLKKVISAVSMNTLAKMHIDEENNKNESSLDDVDVDEITMTFHLLMAVVLAVVSQFLVGYNTSVLNAPEAIVFPGHTTLSWSLAVSAFAIGGPIGSVLGGYLANIKGRKGTMLLNTWIFLIGGSLMTIALDMYWLIVARFIIGFASGIAMVVVPVYLGEIAPPTLRGTLGTCTQFAIVIGILFSNLVAFPLATPSGWRYMFAIGPLLSILQLLSSPYLVESPRWLLSRDEASTQARVEIKKLRAFRLASDVEQEVQNYLYASKHHKTARHSAHSSGAFFDLLFNARDIRILVVSSVVLQIAQQLSGINAVFYYSTTFFQGVIDNPLLGTTLIGFVNLLATIAALKLMDNTERRSLLLWSSTGMIIAMFFIILSLTSVINRGFALGAIMLFVTSFAIGLGPIPWLIVAEMFDSKYVATAMSLACIVNWTCNFLVGLSFPFFNQYLGAYSFAPFCFVLILSHLFIYFYLPETHGRTVEEVYREITAARQPPITPSHDHLGSRSHHFSSSNDPHAEHFRRLSIEEFEEKLVDVPVIQAVELLNLNTSGDNDEESVLLQQRSAQPPASSDLSVVAKSSDSQDPSQKRRSTSRRKEKSSNGVKTEKGSANALGGSSDKLSVDTSDVVTRSIIINDINRHSSNRIVGNPSPRDAAALNTAKYGTSSASSRANSQKWYP